MIHIQNTLNNLFDQYDQLENRITNALLQTMARDPQLLRSFLVSLLKYDLRSNAMIQVSSQKEPFGLGDSEKDKVEGIPDGWIVVDEKDAIVLESKIARNAVRQSQLMAHTKRLRGYNNRILCVITPDDQSPVKDITINGVKIVWISWSEVYGMLATCQTNAIADYLRSQLREYLAMNEDLVGFQGISFPSGSFNYREARTIIRSMIKAIRPDITKIMPGLKYERKAYSQDSHPYTVHHRSVWSYLATDENFTKDMHLTFWIAETHFGMAITVPHNASKRWKRLRSIFNNDASYETLTELLFNVRRELPNLYLEYVHRHYLKMRDGIIDGILEMDIDTFKGQDRVKANPVWYSILRQLIANKKGHNGQLMIRTRYFYIDHPAIQSARFKDTIIDAAKEFKEIYKYLSEE